MKKRVLVYGGRDYNNVREAFLILDYAAHWFEDDALIIGGGAKGADRIGKAWAVQMGYAYAEMCANWNYFGSSAGSIRNCWMDTYLMPDLGIEFPGGTGTAHMRSLLKKRGVDIYVPLQSSGLF